MVAGTPAAQTDTAQAPEPTAPVEEAPAETTDTEGETAETAPTLVPSVTPVPEQEETTTTDAEGEEGGEDDGGEETIGAENVGSDVPSERCTVTPSSGGVVVRDGPSTSFPAIASIPIGEYRFADATDGAWIRIVGDGWVSSGVVDLNGPCGSLPLITVPTSPGGSTNTAQPTATTSAAPVGSR